MFDGKCEEDKTFGLSFSSAPTTYDFQFCNFLGLMTTNRLHFRLIFDIICTKIFFLFRTFRIPIYVFDNRLEKLVPSGTKKEKFELDINKLVATTTGITRYVF